MKKYTRFFAVLSAVVVFSVCGGPSPEKDRGPSGRDADSGGRAAGLTPAGSPGALTDALGRTFTVPPGGAERIVSLSPAVTEILFAAGAGERVVGVTEYCDYPPEARERVSVGGFAGATVSVERIAALESDLVIVSADMHGRILGLLEDIGIPSFALEPRNFDDVFAAIRTVGILSGCRAGAEETVQIMEGKLGDAALLRSGKERPAVYWELSEDPLISAGKDSFVNEALERAGGRNIFGDLDAAWPLVSAEEVLLRRPEWILTGDDRRPVPDAAFFARRPGWADIPAVREGRVVLVNAGRLYRYGPRLADAVLEIAAVIGGGER
ncbi:MAG: cobalamin-binding protein [Treponema sp.]|jgi:iron complex transport system substrate-binding protein|nr:cobalamin-binding protein [Treponema sp.]